jgi:hypothetical protein
MFTKKCKQHLQDVNMTAIQHMRFALWLAGRLSLSVLALVVHAFVPRYFTTYAGDQIDELHAILERMRSGK